MVTAIPRIQSRHPPSRSNRTRSTRGVCAAAVSANAAIVIPTTAMTRSPPFPDLRARCRPASAHGRTRRSLRRCGRGAAGGTARIDHLSAAGRAGNEAAGVGERRMPAVRKEATGGTERVRRAAARRGAARGGATGTRPGTNPPRRLRGRRSIRMEGGEACGRAREGRRPGQAGGSAVSNSSALGARRSAQIIPLARTAPVNRSIEANADFMSVPPMTGG